MKAKVNHKVYGNTPAIDTSACRRNAIHGQTTKHSRVTDVIVQGEDFFSARRSLHGVAKVPTYSITGFFGQGCQQRATLQKASL